jgi:peptidyl-prolyl cis-trans isomerase SurA
MKFLFSAIPLYLLFCAVALAAVGDESGYDELDGIVAVVNDDVIMRSELEEQMNVILARLREEQTQLPPESVIEKQVLERMIVEKLQLQLARQNGIRIDDNALNENLQKIAQKNGMTLSDFRDLLEREGYRYDRFREDIRNQIAITELRKQMVDNRTKVSEQEVDNLLANLHGEGLGNRQYHLGHILIAVPEAANPEAIGKAQRKAEDILASLESGADFRETAIAESDGQQALEGGDLGWLEAGQIPTIFAEIVTKMQPGQVAGPIRSSSGFHIVKLLEERGGERYIITQTRVRHILLRPDDMTSEEQVRSRLLQLEKRINDGEDFATLARSHSQDSVSAANGGELGWVNPGDLVPQFEEAMNRLQIGEVSDPVETPYGWHIIQVEERRVHDSTDELQRSKARQLLRSRKNDEETEIWLRRLRDEAYVEYRLERQ